MEMKIHKESSVPIYLQLSEGIIENIQRGEMEINSMITSERILMKQFDISRATVRQAFDRLEKMGYLRKEHGRGSFITFPNLHQTLGSSYHFAKDMQETIKQPHTEIVFFRIIAPTAQLITIMGLSKDEFVYKIVRVKSADEQPAMLETTFLPYSRFEGLTREDLSSTTLHEVLTMWYRTPITIAVETFELTHLTAQEAKYLGGIESETAMLKERISSYQNQVVEYTKSICLRNTIVFQVISKK